MAIATPAFALAACIGRPASAPQPTAPAYDVLIVDGRVVDGAGNPWYYADVAIRGDRIVRVAPKLPRDGAARIIDARGMVVSPGFIDMLGHSEMSILRHRTAVSKITQGITSEITGEVSSAWPNTVAGENGGAPPQWTSLDGYFRHLDSIGIAINLGTYVGAASVRRAVMGDASRTPTPEELDRMGDLVDQAMRDGAMGFSTGLIYPPSTFFTTAELVMLARRAAAHGGGYASHIRNESDSLLAAIREAIAVGQGAGTWTQIRHLKVNGEANWGSMTAAVALIDSARHADMDVTADLYPYVAAGTGLAAMLPTWAQAGGRDSLLARLRDPVTRARLRADSTGEWWQPADRILINDVRIDSLRIYEGKRLAEVGRLRNQDPFEAAYDILVADSGRTSAIYFAMSEDDLRLAMRQPWVSVGQDAGATTPAADGNGRGHPRGFGTFPRILGHYVRTEGVLSLEEAVRRMTSLAAQRVGLDDRGLLKRGMFADVVVFDPATIRDEATFESPQRTATGVRYVLVNGEIVLDENGITAKLPGRALRGPGHAR
jgi:dihydroorotase/N-acyl-D-amino-acid deacylase